MLTTNVTYKGRTTTRNGWDARREVVSIMDGSTTVDELERIVARRVSETDGDWRIVCERSVWKDRFTRLLNIGAVLDCCDEQFSEEIL